MIFDGAVKAEEIKKQLQARVCELDVVPRLAVILVGDDAVSKSYIEKKKVFGEAVGVGVDIHVCDKDATLEEVQQFVANISADEKYTGVIVQLPLPDKSMTDEVLKCISREKDVDALRKDAVVDAPVVKAVVAVLESGNVEYADKKIVLVGHGRLVGKPLESFFKKQGIEVTIVTKETEQKEEILRGADIIISGSGKPGSITPEMVKDRAVLIDAGTASEAGEIKGDVDPACREKATLYTPVPGGIGPLTVAYLFENLIDIKK